LSLHEVYLHHLITNTCICFQGEHHRRYTVAITYLVPLLFRNLSLILTIIVDDFSISHARHSTLLMMRYTVP
jgi:hypothetical protein